MEAHTLDHRGRSAVSGHRWRTCGYKRAQRPGGEGKLIGVVMSDFRLTKPFKLGTDGEFVATASGKLYLRCNDNWNKLADNGGKIRVELTQ